MILRGGEVSRHTCPNPRIVMIGNPGKDEIGGEGEMTEYHVLYRIGEQRGRPNREIPHGVVSRTDTSNEPHLHRIRVQAHRIERKERVNSSGIVVHVGLDCYGIKSPGLHTPVDICGAEGAVNVSRSVLCSE